MAAQPSRNKPNLTPGKMGLIGVLSLVLVGVIGMQLLDSGTAARPLAPSLASAASSEPEVDQASSSTAETTATPRPEFRNWEAITLDEALRHDPFVLPKELRSRAGTNLHPVLPTPQDPNGEEMERRREDTLANFREQGVGMIWSTREGYVATVGQRELRVGDEFDGLRVAEISPRGIVLVEQETP